MYSRKPSRDVRRRFEARRGTRGLALEPLESRTLLSVSPNLIDLNPYGASAPSDFVQVGDATYFVAEDGDYGRELWVTDGSRAGTVMVKDIYEGTFTGYYGTYPNSSNPSGLTEFNGELFFAADDGVNGRELWKSDGTPEGTVLVHDVAPGEGYQYPYGSGPLRSLPDDLTVSNGKLFFSAEDLTYGRELWMTDGTSSGTVMVKDIADGTFSDNYGTYPNASKPRNMVDFDGTLLFTADDGSNGRELWRSDGTESGTVMVKDIFPGTSPYYGYYGYYYGQNSNSSNPANLTVMDGQLFFIAEDETYGMELWKSDGTSSGTALVEDIASGTADAFTEDSPLLVVGDTLFFAADDGTHGDELWASDGTAGGTKLVKDIHPGAEGNLSYFNGFTGMGDTLFFSAADGTYGRELWKSDGTEAGTVLVADVNPGTDYYGAPNASYPFYMKGVDGTLYFSGAHISSGRELWMSDGTAEGTVLVDDTTAGTQGTYPNSLETIDGVLLYSGNDGDGRELWSLNLDGVGNNTVQLTISVNGQLVTIPDNLGVDSGGDTAPVHTTDTTGTLLLESAGTTLGDFFDIWRTDAGLAGNHADAVFSKDELLGNTADTVNTVQMYVNGQISADFDEYILQDNDQVVLVYGSNPVLSLNTNFGPIVIELFEEATPGTVDNFLNYVNDGDYLNSFFHRSVDDFVIQGGGFTTGSTTFTSVSQFSDVPADAMIANEPGISNLRGTIAMAKQGGYPDSATSQFFVNLSDTNTFLDTEEYDYFTVFAQVLDMTTVDEIASLTIDTSNTSPFGELPLSSSDQLVVVQAVEGQGEVSGVKFLDENADGYLDSGDTLLSGVTVYVDSNENGLLDTEEVSTITDANGEYLLQVEAGTHQIRAEVSAGRITTRPASSGSYAITVEIGRETADVDFGEAELSVPENVALLPVSDTGTANDDALTRLNNSSSTAALQFQVDGVIDGAEVSLYSDGVLVGTATASNGTATILTDGLTTLSDGVRSITATQSFGGGTSVPSTALAVTIDTIAPAGLDEAPPDFPQVNEPYAFNAESAEEGQGGIQYSLVGAPAGMTIDADRGVLNWTPALEQAIPQDFEIVITDGAGNLTSQLVEMTVLGVIPAYPDEYTTDEDTTLTIGVASGVLSNDGDGESGELNAVLVDQPSNGTVALNGDGSFVYTPTADYFGADRFTYRASDGSDDSNVAGVDITISNVNDPPAPAADSYTTLEDVSIAIDSDTGVLANDVDIDGDVLTASLVAQATNGTVTLNSDGSFSYVPDDEFSGSDSFTYVVSDGAVQSDPITVSLTIENVPDPPTSVSDAYSVSEDATLTIDVASGVLANDTDPDSETLTASVTANPSKGTLSLNSDGSFTYVPVANFYGTDSFTYVSSDETSTSSAATVTITVNNVADAPTAIDDTLTAPNDGTSVLLDVLGNDTSEPDPGQALSIVSVTQGVVGGTVTIEGDSVRYVAPYGVTGTDTFTYTIQDSDGLTDTATASVSIESSVPLDGAGSSGDASLSGYAFIDADRDGVRDAGEYGAAGVQITLTGADSFGNSVNRSVLTQGNGYYLFDGLGAGTYELTEQQPTALGDGPESTTVPAAVVSDDRITSLVLTSGDHYTENNFAETGLLAQYLSLRMFLASSPSPEECLLDAIVEAEILAGNAALAESIRSGDINFDDDNTAAPVASADTYSAAAGTLLTVNAGSGVLANDTDSDGDSLTSVVVAPPSNGSIALSADGSFVYAPNSGFYGTDSFTYGAYDGKYLSNTTTVTITVIKENAAPAAISDAYSANEDTTLNVDASTGVLSNDSGADGDTLSATLHSEPANGSLLLNADGSFTYTPNADFHGSDSFTYRADDGESDSAVTTVAITVVSVNDAPVAADDSYSTAYGDTLTVNAASGVLDNDGDVDGDEFTATGVGVPSHGSCVLNADGSFTYTPEDGYSGTDSLTYLADDGVDTSAEATVWITVNGPLNSAPEAVADDYEVAEDSVLAVDAVFGLLGNDSDDDGDTLSVALVDSPSYGTLSLNSDGSFTYTPDADYSGTDSFTYTASDGTNESDATTVSLTVTEVDDLSVVTLPEEFTDPDNVAQRTVGESIEFTVGVSDVDDDMFAFQLDLESSGIPDGAAVPTIDAGTGVFQWTPGVTGEFEICVIVVSEDGEANQESFSLIIIPEN